MLWKLTGTDTQKAIVLDAFGRIKFPFERLAITWQPELGWRDLNSGFNSEGELPAAAMLGARGHEGKFHGEEGEPEPLNGELEGRRFTMGVFYPGSARIYIDHRLADYPAMAQATLAAEVAHAVDEFLPLSEAQRDDIIRLLGGVPGQMTWWEKQDYSTEYWTLAGEHFMPLFTDAYSDIPFGDTSSFSHSPSNIDPDALVAIVGVNRTDHVPVTPPAPPPPTEPVLPPEEPLEPLVPDEERFVRYGKSKVYHRQSHRVRSKNQEMIMFADGLRPCKVCKPA